MAGGFAGKLLNVDLSSGKVEVEIPDESLYRDYIGGYGIGSRVIYSRQRGGVDALGPENIFGLTTGPLAGTHIPFGSRFYAVGKSPITGTWGDANGGGYFGPTLKFAGFDGVFVRGAASNPVYIYINEGKAEIRDASDLWGRDAIETEDILKSQLGQDAQVACIGTAGEKLSFISGVVNDKGRLAARAGLGAVMGSKRLKAVVAKGKQAVPVADAKQAIQLRNEFLKVSRNPGRERMHKYGTAGALAGLVAGDDTPNKNWGGVGPIDFPNYALISDDNVIKYEVKKYACYRCPTACGGHLKITQGPYAVEGHKPEYETLASFGAMCLNENVESIIKANDICNRAGLDTIGAGATIAFAIECYENGLISKADTGGIELTWGNHAAIVAMTELMGRREGFGDVLADGIKAAAERIGKGADKFAIHIQGETLGMHDPKYRVADFPRFLDSKPGNHMQGGSGVAVFNRHTMNSTGLCAFGFFGPGLEGWVPKFLTAVTGWEIDDAEYTRIGERIANVRHAFNLREGLHPAKFNVPDRVLGRPPKTQGPLAGVSVDLDTQLKGMYESRGWDLATGKPSKEKLVSLGLTDIAKDLYGSV